MNMLVLKKLLLFGFAILAVRSSYSPGPSECLSLKPSFQETPMAIPPPFNVKISDDVYSPLGRYNVTVTLDKGANKINGFHIQARRKENSYNQHEAVGNFLVSSNTMITCSGSSGAGLKNKGNQIDVDKIKLLWIAPRTLEGDIHFLVTVIQDEEHYWVAESSPILRDPRKPPITTPDDGIFEPIDVSTCGSDKGCYRTTDGCTGTTCRMLVTWKQHDDYVEFEMTGDSNGWVAIGFSEDTKMGDDEVLECVRKIDANEVSTVDVRMSKNLGGRKHNQVIINANKIISNEEGQFKDGRISCRFQRKLNYGQTVDLSNDYRLLMAWGNVEQRHDGNVLKLMHSMEPHKYPHVSQSRVILKDHDNISGSYRWALVKLHGILMVIAWLVCGNTGTLIAFFYKLMWPNDRCCRNKVWFSVHRGLMLSCIICTVVGVILIFIHVGGWSAMPYCPGKAHPILGIIVVIAAVINPFWICCRGSKPKSNRRSCLNWMHWTFGTVAGSLAISAMSIGLNLPKVFAPWWTGWVMTFACLFFFICILLLLIHSCINGPKQEEKDRTFQLEKLGDVTSDERYKPEPVGRRFKKTVLSLHLFVCIVCAIIIIFAIIFG